MSRRWRALKHPPNRQKNCIDRGIRSIEVCRLRIALALQLPRPARGGQERYSLMLADRLVDRGCEVSILASEFDDAPARWNRVCVCQLPRGHTRRYRGYVNALDHHLQLHKYDAVHAMIPVRYCDVYHPHSGLAAEQDRRGYLKHASWPMRRLAQVGNQFNVKRRLLHQLGTRVARTLASGGRALPVKHSRRSNPSALSESGPAVCRHAAKWRRYKSFSASQRSRRDSPEIWLCA